MADYQAKERNVSRKGSRGKVGSLISMGVFHITLRCLDLTSFNMVRQGELVHKPLLVMTANIVFYYLAEQ